MSLKNRIKGQQSGWRTVLGTSLESAFGKVPFLPRVFSMGCRIDGSHASLSHHYIKIRLTLMTVFGTGYPFPHILCFQVVETIRLQYECVKMSRQNDVEADFLR
jgi:hypothetical protein